jgi:hypothetical protein
LSLTEATPVRQPGGYLRRLAARRDNAALKRHIVFGLVLGWMLVIVCGSRYLFAVGANDPVWHAGLLLGCGMLALTLVAPGLLAPAEHLLKLFGETIGKLMFGLVLGVIYYLLFTPVGYFMRRGGSRPFCSWGEVGPGSSFEDWTPRAREPGPASAGTRNLPLIAQPVVVMAHFVRQGRFLFIPALLLMIVFGLMLFFVQSSALAPFVYTLF